MKFLKQATYIKYVIAKLSKFVQILFTEDSLKIKKGLELVSRPHFSYNFLIKNFILQYYINWPNLITGLCLLPKLFNNMCFVFHAWAFNDVMIFEYLKI